MMSKWSGGPRGLEGLDWDGEALADEGPLRPQAPRRLVREGGHGVDLWAERAKKQFLMAFQAFQSGLVVFWSVLYICGGVLGCFRAFGTPKLSTPNSFQVVTK